MITVPQINYSGPIDFIDLIKNITFLIFSLPLLTGCDDSLTKSGVDTLEGCQYELEKFHTFYYINTSKILASATKLNTDRCLGQTKIETLKNFQQKFSDCSFLYRLELHNKKGTTANTSKYDDIYLSLSRYIRTIERCNQTSDKRLLLLLRKQLENNSDAIHMHLSKVPFRN